MMALANSAHRDLNSGSSETTLDGVISKSVLRSLLGALHYRDVGTLRHSRRVALLAVGLASHLGWEGRHLRVLEVAALLHDIGKIGVPDNVLYKPGKLSFEEIELMGLHHGIGLNVLQACRVDHEVLRIVDQAHRAYDARERNKNSIRDVHIGARILAVADAYESMCTEQVYRGAKSHDDIMNLLIAESGKQFDGNIVNCLARWVQQDGLPFAAQTAELHETLHRSTPFTLEEAAEAMALCQIFSYLYMLESLYDGFHLVDADRRFIVWNRGSERLAGRSALTMLGESWSPELFATAVEESGVRPAGSNTAHAEPAESSLDHAINTARPVIYQFDYRRPDGSTVPLEMQTVPLFDARGRLHGVAEIFRNLARKSHVPEFNQLKLQASRDALTSVANRGELEFQLKQLAEQFAANPDDPFSVIFADADHFKRVNDTYGHQVGDQVLIDLARHFSEETYSGEIVGRYGGEEFVILCPSTTTEQAVRRADRLRTSLKNAKIGGNDRLKITCSFGVAQMEPGDSPETLLRRADQALYAAKEAGRDRTCSYTAAQLRELDDRNQQDDDTGIHYHFTSSFAAVLAADMAVHKLGGFVKDHHAQLVDVSRDRVLLRLNGAGLFGFFRSSGERQGLEIELLMEGSSRGVGLQKLRINVAMKPYGWFRDPKCFKDRTRSVLRELKQYFAAE
jgi:diguanylate cyclase (GGDEF)-like protein/putative nucleotidyltransferase with HDIG domain